MNSSCEVLEGNIPQISKKNPKEFLLTVSPCILYTVWKGLPPKVLKFSDFFFCCKNVAFQSLNGVELSDWLCNIGMNMCERDLMTMASGELEESDSSRNLELNLVHRNGYNLDLSLLVGLESALKVTVDGGRGRIVVGGEGVENGSDHEVHA